MGRVAGKGMAGGGLLTVGLCCRAATCSAAPLPIAWVPINDLHRDRECNQGSMGDAIMRHVLGVILLLAVGSANAYDVVYSSPRVVTGIGKLDLGGTLYNIDFETGVYSTFGGVEDF